LGRFLSIPGGRGRGNPLTEKGAWPEEKKGRLLSLLFTGKKKKGENAYFTGRGGKKEAFGERGNST